MQQQLDFWPDAQKAPYGQKQWEALSIEDRAKLTNKLAHLIAQAICPERIEAPQEKDHEQ